ncbi:MAG TPA: TonB-dependent receptor [Acidobacteriota bacterium]|nr:TonB-dependent receptor [Acidobacteriota bacterium]
MVRRTFFFLFCLILIAGAAHAQRVTGSIRGDVRDDTGAPLPGVNVTIAGPALIGGSQLSVTDDTGTYRFPTLPPGTYVLSFAMEGFQPVRYSDIRVVLGTTVEQNVTMKLSQVKEEMEVTGETPLIDATKPGMSTNYTQEYLQDTPVSRFSFFDFVQMAPGSSPMRFDNTSYAHSILGSNTNENMYQMDGVDLTSSTTGAAWPWPNTDIIEEIEILDIGAPAEYGNYQGAVVNVVTKSGGNVVHGDGNFYFQTQGLTGQNAEIDGIPYHRDKYLDGTFQIGGPIMKDKVWFFTGFQSRREHFSEPGTPPESPKREDDDRIFFKVTYDINQKNKLTASLHDDFYNIPLNVTVTQPIETALTETGSNPTPNVMWSSTINDHTILEVKYAGFWGHDIGKPQNGKYVSGHYDFYTGAHSVGILSWYDGHLWKSQWAGKLSYFADNFIKGDHDFRFGAQYNSAGSNYIYAYTNGVKYYDYNGAPYSAYFQLPYHIGADSKSLGLFADDTWHFSDALTFNLGVRFDHSVGSIPDFPQLNADGKETGTTVKGLDNLAKWDVISPRLGMTYNFPWKKASQIRASYGRYYQALLTTYLQRAGPARAPIQGYSFNPDTGKYDSLFFALDPSSQVKIDPNLKDPYTDQYAVGWDQQLDASTALSMSYIYKKSYDYIGTINTGATYEAIPFIDPVTGHAITVYNQTNDPTADNLYFITNPSFFYSRYDGFIVSVNRRMSKKWMMNGSLTISKTKGFDAGSSLGPSADQDSSFFPSENAKFGTDKNDFTNANGLLNGDRTYIFKFQGNYDLPWTMKVSADYSYMTGRPYARQIAVTGLNQGTRVIFAETRDGNRRTSNISLLDLRWEKDLELKGSFTAIVSLDFMNILNSSAFYDVATTLSGPGTEGSFGVGSIFVPPRRVMVGLKLHF